MQAVADAVAAGEDPRDTQRYQPYVNNSRPLRFELRKIARDEKRAKEYASGGWLKNPEALRRLEYRLRDARGKEVDRFKLWVELRASSPDDPFPRPHLPVAYEYEPAGYLRLRAVRVAGAWLGIVRPSMNRWRARAEKKHSGFPLSPRERAGRGPTGLFWVRRRPCATSA